MFICKYLSRKNVSLFKNRKVNFSCDQKQRRVVVTGLGVVSPVGCNVKTAWNAIIEGECGIVKLGKEYEKLPCKVAALINQNDLELKKKLSSGELRTMSLATAYSMISSKEALEDANWNPQTDNDKERTGVSIGMGMIDLRDVCETNEALKTGYNKVNPFFVTRILPNMATGQISIKYGFRGPNHAVSTACATGCHAIGDAFRFIKNGDADVMVCGGAEACISPLAIAAFCRLRALSTSFNNSPECASRPFDKDRDGFVMGEGAAILILEELNHALARNTHIYAEIRGYGLSGDGSHMTAPKEDGSGAVLSMRRALEEAGLDANTLSYVNAHATSTPLGDTIELKAIQELCKNHSSKIFVSSTKGAHGHLLGAAGAIETVFTVKAIEEGILPPTINAHNISLDTELNIVALRKKEFVSVDKITLKNAFGFGGTNATLCLSEFL